MSPLIPFYPSIVSPRIIHPMFSNFIRACATAARTCTVHSNSVLKHINVTLQELQRTQLMGPPYRKMIHHHKSQNMPLLKKTKNILSGVFSLCDFGHCFATIPEELVTLDFDIQLYLRWIMFCLGLVSRQWFWLCSRSAAAVCFFNDLLKSFF